MSETSTPYLLRLPDGTVADHAPRSQHLIGYQRRPLTPRHSTPQPVHAALTSTGPAPSGLVDAHTAAAIVGVPAVVLAGWALRDPQRVPGATVLGGEVFFDPTRLQAVTA